MASPFARVRSRLAGRWRFFWGPPAQERSRAIDLVRGIAILLVLGCHYVVPPEQAGVFEPVARLWYRVGWAGVDLFFVLSGFLVSRLLFAEFQRTQRVDIGRFLVRRGLKIWPAYFVYLAFLALWMGWTQPAGEGAGAIWPNLLHVQNYFGSPRVHTWSLAVEEHFYLLAAVAWTWVLTPHHLAALRCLFPVMAWLAIGTVAVARHMGFVDAGGGALNLFATHLRFDGLLVGTLMAYFTHFAPERLDPWRRHPWLCLAAGTLLAAPVLWLTPEHGAWSASLGLGLMYPGFALLILGVVSLECAGQRWRRLFSAPLGRWLARVGVFSYGIYLWFVDLAQTPIKKVVALAPDFHLPAWAHWLAWTSAYVVLAFLGGALMSRLVELPVLALRDRFFPSNAKRDPGARPAVAAGPEAMPVPPSLAAARAS